MGNNIQKLQMLQGLGQQTEGQASMSPGYNQMQAARGMNPDISTGMVPQTFPNRPAYPISGMDMAGDQGFSHGPTGGLGGGNSQLKQALAMMLSKIRR